MKKYFLFILLSFSLSLNHTVFCQDIIKTKSGEEIKARLLKTTRKEATYQTYNDPEFSTYTMPYKELASIQMEGAKKPILFNHHLPRGYIALTFNGQGSNIPLGDLAKTSYSSSENEPGFAKPGMSVKLEGVFYIYKKLGLSIGFGQYVNKFDYVKYANSFNGPGSGFFAQSQFYDSTSGNGNHGKDTESWRFTHFLIGPIYSIKLAKRFTLDFRARVGNIVTSKPDVILSYSYQSFQYRYRFHSKKHAEFGYNFGTSFRFSMSRRLALIATADYFHTAPTLSMEVTDMNSSYGGSTGTEIKYKFDSFTYCIGLAYQFKRKGNKYE
jgi:hypothetical protein